MKREKTRQILVIIVVIATIILNYGSNVMPFGGHSNKEISDNYPTDFTPASFAFSIWGIIYLGLIGFAIYQAQPSQRNNPRFRAIRLPVMLNGLFNCLWLPLFQHEQFFLSVLVIIGILYTLCRINLRLQLNGIHASIMERWLAQVPFGIYFGWVSVATIANISIWLRSINWNGWGVSGSAWASSMIVVGLIIGLFIFTKLRNFAYLLVFVWAFAAIAAGQWGNALVSTVAMAGAIVAAAVVVVNLFYFPKRLSKSHR